MIHFPNPPVPLENSSQHFQPDSPLHTLQKNTQDSILSKADNSLDCSSIQTQSSFHRDLQEVNLQPLHRELEIPLGEPFKKCRVEGNDLNMATETAEFCSQLSSNGTLHKQNEPLSVTDPVFSLTGKRSSNKPSPNKEAKGNLLANFAGAFKPVVMPEKEIIDLEEAGEDEKTDEDSLPPLNELSTEPFFVIDEVTLEFQRAKDQLLKQIMMKNIMNQVDSSAHRPQINSNLLSWLSLQAGQTNQRNQFNQDIYQNPMLNNSLGNVNPMYVSNLINNIKFAHVARQTQAKFQFQPSSLLGKRENPYENVENFQNELLRAKLVEYIKARQPEVIVLDDEERQLKPKKQDPYENWTYNPNKKVFKIEKIVKKRIIKKQIFKIINTKPKSRSRPLISKFNIARRSVPLFKKETVKTVQVEESKENKPVSLSMTVSQTKQETSQRKGSIELEKKENESDSVSRRKESRKFDDEDDDYTINLHAKTEEDDKNLVLTPIGREFQMKVQPFVKPNVRKRKLKSVWDPEKVDRNIINEYFKEVETRFEKPIVNQALALKVFKECGMDVEKVVESLENNKVYKRDFFEVRQKVLRNRMLHHEIFS